VTTSFHIALVAALDGVGVADPAEQLATDPQISFSQLDVDSLGVIEVVTRLEEEFGITIDETVLRDVDRPAGLAPYFVATTAGSH
jgi:acyl carrier protein